jgi:hypothetical protein
MPGDRGELTKEPDPSRPAWGARQPFRPSEGCLVQRIFNQRVVQRLEHDRPEYDRQTAYVHPERVADEAARRRVEELEGVRAVESVGLLESKDDAPPRHVVHDIVSNGAVPSVGADGERSVECDLGPPLMRPEPILRGGQAVNQPGRVYAAGVQDTLVYIDDSHRNLHFRDSSL